MSMYIHKVLYTMVMLFFFFKQKTAYEMRISDWSSDVCSSDLREQRLQRGADVVEVHFLRVQRTARCLHVILQFLRALVAAVAVLHRHRPDAEIGRASCRERVCQYV